MGLKSGKYWKKQQTEDRQGQVLEIGDRVSFEEDGKKVLGKVVEITSPKRVGVKTLTGPSVKVWLNSKNVFLLNKWGKEESTIFLH